MRKSTGPRAGAGTIRMDVDQVIVGAGAGARRIAVRRRAGASPGFVWLGGYRSDMAGTKAQALDAWCAGRGLACCRHDYSGHGQSGGEFRDGTISRWLEESLAVFDAFTSGPQVLVGSSMGAWIALRMAGELARRGEAARLHAMLLIAPAPDFTEALMWPSLSEAQKRRIERDGFLEAPSQYSDEPNLYTRALFEDGREHLVMSGPIATGCPVHILQGMADPDVPWRHAMRLAELLAGEAVTVTLVKDGDHRLSRPADIDLMLRIAEGLAAR
ncbi:MAG: 2-hydroxymuconic semialdehyde hydrolase [Alphaproteobacteria bacterium]|nr:MAG: 2-hydroxymuconic semialdehyde hydrolase [Alphaproteobacteria bacterium]